MTHSYLPSSNPTTAHCILIYQFASSRVVGSSLIYLPPPHFIQDTFTLLLRHGEIFIRRPYPYWQGELQGMGTRHSWSRLVEQLFVPPRRRQLCLNDYGNRRTQGRCNQGRKCSLSVGNSETRAQGAICLTVTTVIALDLNALATIKKEGEEAAKPTAFDMWQHLRTKYKTRDGVTSLLNFKKFIHTSFVNDGTLEDQLNRHLELRHHCAVNDFVVPDWQYASLILLALPTSYSHVQDSFLTTSSVKNLKPDEVRSKILETEIRHKEGNTTAAYSLSTQTPAKGKKNANATSSSSNLNAVDKSNVKCFYCHKKGHMANVCRKKKKEKGEKKKEKPGSGSAKPNAASSSNLNVVASDDEYDASPLCAYFGAPENWLVDSGATDHMTPFGSDITDYVSFAEAQ